MAEGNTQHVMVVHGPKQTRTEANPPRILSNRKQVLSQSKSRVRRNNPEYATKSEVQCFIHCVHIQRSEQQNVLHKEQTHPGATQSLEEMVNRSQTVHVTGE